VDCSGRANIDFLPALINQLRALGKQSTAGSSEPVDFARPRAGHNIGSSITIQIHQLWSEADASPTWHAAQVGTGAKQILHAVAVKITQARRRVPDALYIERYPAGYHMNRLM
jgi:hypothetical protein